MNIYNSLFIDTIRKYQTLGTEDPFEHAIKECIEKGTQFTVPDTLDKVISQQNNSQK